jgi:coronin-1B/1C/6
VLDTDWSPFNDDIIASGSDDGKVFLWQVPDNFTLHTDAEEVEDVKPVGKLSGHSRKVGHVLFNPAAENVLASSSGDYTVKLWDLEDGKSKLTLKHNDIVQSLSWSANGSMLVTTSRDKKLRFWDVRQEKPAHEVPGHTGAKNSRVVWLGEHDRVATTGFSRMSERQLGLWDIRNPEKAVAMDFLDSSSGVGMPFWDDGTQMLFLGGKGDGNIRYFEFENDKFEPLSEYKSGDPQRGLAFMPKRGVNTHENEVMRAYKTVNDQWIEPVSFIVPRRSETFQDDIYPPAVGSKPAVSSGEWFEGKTGLPPKINMADLFNGQEPQEIAAEHLPKPTTTRSAPEPTPVPSPAKKVQPEVTKPEPSPSIATEKPKFEDNKTSMADMASKFADKDEGQDEDEEEPFEEIQKPVERPTAVQAAKREPEPSRAPAPAVTEPPKPAPAASTTTAAAPAAIAKPTEEPAKTDDATQTATSPQPQPSVASAAGGLRDVLQEIRGMLQSQGKQIEQLTSEVAQLKAKVEG